MMVNIKGDLSHVLNQNLLGDEYSPTHCKNWNKHKEWIERKATQNEER